MSPGGGPGAAVRPLGAGGPEGRVLVVGMGNVLRGDDGFGVAVAEALEARALPASVELMEVGIGGMHLVQALLDGYDALVIVDAVDRGAEPGTLFVLRPEVPELDPAAPGERHEVLADLHHTVPSRALLMARAVGALPERVWIVGCQPAGVDDLGIGLSDVVRAAVPEAVARVEALVASVDADAPGAEESAAEAPAAEAPGAAAGPTAPEGARAPTVAEREERGMRE